jgi:hypothetical protein
MKIALSALALGLSLSAATASAAPIMYVDDSSGRLGTVDVATGAATFIGNMGVILTDIAFDPLGNLYGLSFTTLYSINASTAAVSLIGAHGIPSGNALVFGSNGTLYGAGATSTSLFTLNPATGAGSAVGNMGFASGGDLAFNGGNFYLASSSNQLVRVNPTTGAGTLVGNFGVPNVFGLATGDNGVLYGVAGTTVYTINTVTGAASNPVPYGGALGQAFGESFFLEANPTAVPEPGTLTLVGFGLVGAWRARRRAVMRRN